MRLVTASCWHRQPGRCSLSGSRPFACSCASMKDRGRFMKDWMCASHVGRFAHSGPMTSTARNAAHRARAPLASTASSRTSVPAPSAVARCGAVCQVRRTSDASTAAERSEVETCWRERRRSCCVASPLLMAASDGDALNKSTPGMRLSRPRGPRGGSVEAFNQEAAPSRGDLRGAEAGSLPDRRDVAHSDSSPETSALRALRAVRISPEAPRLLMSSCISASGTVNQRLVGARGLSMRGETIRRDLGGGRPGTRPRHSAGPPRETFAHATPCRKTAYARRKTRTPRPWGQGVHSEPFGAPVSRAPFEVGRAGFEPASYRL